MSSTKTTGSEWRGTRPFALAALLVLIIGVFGALWSVYARRQPSGPRLLNEPTKAREVRPLTTERDPRFAPLPLEEEKHGK
jgi:hypothetical protein